MINSMKITLALLVFLLIPTFLFTSCESQEEKEQAQKDKIFQLKQDSIQQVIESLRQREEANKNLIHNVRKMCEYQLLQLENGSPEDSLRLAEFTQKMKRIYPDSDRNVLRRIAMNIDPCEEYRTKVSKKRKN